MKNLFAIDIDKDQCEFDPFVIRRVDTELSEKQEEAVEKLEEHGKRSALPAWLRIIKYICLWWFLIVIGNVIKVGKEAFSNAPVLCALGLLGGVIGVSLWAVEKKKTKNTVESDDFKDGVESSAAFTEECYAELGVPEDAKQADIFTKPYKMKNGKEKKASSWFEYVNQEVDIFLEGNMLCIADVNNVIGLPIEDMTGIYKINKRVSFLGWNKAEGFNQAPYKQYKMTCNQFGMIFIKTHYSLRFSSFGTEYEILFPAYELDTFTSLTGLSVKENA